MKKSTKRFFSTLLLGSISTIGLFSTVGCKNREDVFAKLNISTNINELKITQKNKQNELLKLNFFTSDEYIIEKTNEWTIEKAETLDLYNLFFRIKATHKSSKQTKFFKVKLSFRFEEEFEPNPSTPNLNILKSTIQEIKNHKTLLLANVLITNETNPNLIDKGKKFVSQESINKLDLAIEAAQQIDSDEAAKTAKTQLENAFEEFKQSIKIGTKEPNPQTQPDPGAYTYDNNNNYYSSLNGLNSIQLINKLTEIQHSHINEKGWGYNNLFETYKDAFVDKYYEKDGSVLDIYGENPSGQDPFVFKHGEYRDQGSAEGEGMNREHLLAQSWWGKSNGPMKTDAHHVWPTDKKVNAVHGNLPFGTVVLSRYNSKNGTKIGRSAEDDKDVCEVIDEFKGDVARAFFYFVFTYRKKYNFRKNESAQRFLDPQHNINSNFLKTMLDWHYKDPVDRFDIDRNNGVAKHQKIRNPFTDYPILIDLIFGNKDIEDFNNKGVLI